MAGGSASKNKGNSGERELAKILSELLGGSFTRVAGSGAFTGGKNVHRKAALSVTQNRAHKGDIMAPDHLPKLVIEVKFYSDFPFHALLTDGPVPILDQWIGQAMEANDPGDEWFVTIKINRRGWFVVIPATHATDYRIAANHASYTGKHGDFKITGLRRFFEDNKDAVIRRSSSVVVDAKG